MRLQQVDVLDQLDPYIFKVKYFEAALPVVIKSLSKDWPALKMWNWDYLKDRVGHQKVALYNNVKSDAYTPINTADDYKTFGEYINMIQKGPAAWRIFLFNVFDHAPQMVKDFIWPDQYLKGFVKKYPMLFVGGEGSITHMHFDIDMSHILHTQFLGRKRVLLFPHSEKDKLYRKPFEVLSLADFSHFGLPHSKLDMEKFPALQHANGYEIILEHGDTLFMPAGYWHHMEYIESGFAVSLRALQPTLVGKLQGAWNLFGMRTIDTLLKKFIPRPWYTWKEKKILERANRALQNE